MTFFTPEIKRSKQYEFLVTFYILHKLSLCICTDRKPELEGLKKCHKGLSTPPENTKLEGF